MPHTLTTRFVRHAAAIATMLLAAVSAAAVSPYPALETRADRFFQQREWASASAVYDLMLDERPGVPATYGRAIVSATLAGDTLAGKRLFDKAIENHVPFDSVFSRVRSTSFELGRSSLYERFLLDVKDGHPWMRRTVDGYLLRYYRFRRDGARMVEYSRVMLAGAPDNVEFRLIMASGLMLTGDYDGALAVYRGVLESDPVNYDALLELGNWYYLRREGGDETAAEEAVEYLSRAYAVRGTPHVEALLARLGAVPAQGPKRGK